MSTYTDPYAASRETTEGTVFSVTGGDWDSLVTEIGQAKEERVVVNMGPQHPYSNSKAKQLQKFDAESVICTQESKKTLSIATGHKVSHLLLVWIICHHFSTRLHIA